MFKLIYRLWRTVMIAAVGAAIAAKFILESNAEPDTEEIDLVAIFEGRELISTADPFYGGKVMSMFGGVMMDLRQATPAPTGIDIDLMVAMGGVSVVVPEGWRVTRNVKIFAGGLDDRSKPTAEDDAPVLNLKGMVAMGGVQIVAKPPVETSP